MHKQINISGLGSGLALCNLVVPVYSRKKNSFLTNPTPSVTSYVVSMRGKSKDNQQMQLVKMGSAIAGTTAAI